MKILKHIAVAIALVGLLLFVFREPIKTAVYAKITANMFVAIDNDDFDPGIQTGQKLPNVDLRYRGQAIKSLEESIGQRGAAIYFVRSIDWCPFCIQQMIELESAVQHYRSSDIALLAITYDSEALQQDFVDRYDISYPLMSDPNSSTIKTLGLLNEEHQPDDWAYGIPHPGIIFIDPQLRVTGKVFLRDYRKRVTAAAVFELANKVL